MAWHPIRRATRKLVDHRDRREQAHAGAVSERTRASHWGLERVGLFDSLGADEVAQLSARATRSEHQRGAPAIVDDDAVRVVMSGGLKLAKVSAFGRRVIVALLAPGDVFGRLTASGEVEPHVIEALEDTVVLAIPRGEFDRLLERAEFSRRVVQLLEDRERVLTARMESLVFKDARTRLIEVLLELAQVHGEPCTHGMAVDVRINQQDLADLIGASRQIVNRVLRELSRKLYVRQMGKVLCILNRSRLERLVSTS